MCDLPSRHFVASFERLTYLMWSKLNSSGASGYWLGAGDGVATEVDRDDDGVGVESMAVIGSFNEGNEGTSGEKSLQSCPPKSLQSLTARSRSAISPHRLRRHGLSWCKLHHGAPVTPWCSRSLTPTPSLGGVHQTNTNKHHTINITGGT